MEQAKRFNKGKLRWSLVSFSALEWLVKVLMFGAEKYGAHNWKKGLPQNELLDSMMRHVVALNNGEEFDKESGLHHIGHVLCNAMFYAHYYNEKYWDKVVIEDATEEKIKYEILHRDPTEEELKDVRYYTYRITEEGKYIRNVTVTVRILDENYCPDKSLEEAAVNHYIKVTPNTVNREKVKATLIDAQGWVEDCVLNKREELKEDTCKEEKEDVIVYKFRILQGMFNTVGHQDVPSNFLGDGVTPTHEQFAEEAVRRYKERYPTGIHLRAQVINLGKRATSSKDVEGYLYNIYDGDRVVGWITLRAEDYKDVNYQGLGMCTEAIALFRSRSKEIFANELRAVFSNHTFKK